MAVSVLAFLLLLALAVVTATLHPDPSRQADACRVLTALLTIVPARRHW